MTTNSNIQKIEDYKLFASNGRYIRKATCIVLKNGRVIAFTEKMTKKEAINQLSKRLSFNPVAFQ